MLLQRFLQLKGLVTVGVTAALEGWLEMQSVDSKVVAMHKLTIMRVEAALEVCQVAQVCY